MMRQGWLGVSFVSAALLVGFASSGCVEAGGEEEAPPAQTAAPAPESLPASPERGEPSVSVRVLRSLEPGQLEFPEGLAIRDGQIFVGLAPKYRVDRLLDDGTLEPFATFPDGGFGFGNSLLGLAFDASGRLYAALASESGKATTGIYRTAPSGGQAELFATAPGLTHPNALAFDRDGALLFTDSSTGAIWRAGEDGEATRIVQDPLLEGDVSTCPDSQPKRSSRYGANGLLVKDGGEILVVNSEKATVNRVTPEGRVEVLYGPDCELLYGADGIVEDGDSLLVSGHWTKKIVRVRGKEAKVIAEHEAMTAPASLAWRDASRTELVITNLAVDDAIALRPASPGVLAAAFTR